ncbi:MAG: hypothetical protein IJI03_01650, partial [Rudaea sp.]|nr:hypothetical protein [Rudaea sp.]
AAANTSPINATLSVQNQLSVTKSFAAGNVFVDGSPTTMTIQISNPTQYPVSNLAFNDAFPGGPGFVLDASAGGSAPVVSDSCNFNHANVTDGAGALDVASGSIAANGSCQIVVWVRGSTAGAYVNQLGVNTVTGTGGANGTTPTSNGNAASATLSVNTISNGGGPGNYKPNLYKRLSTAPWMPGNPPFNTYLRVTRPAAPATQEVAYVFVAVENTLTTSALNLATLSDVLDSAGFTNIAGRSLRIDPATVAQNVTYGAYANTTAQTCSLGTVTATGSTATTLNLQFANTSVPAAAAQSDGSINPGTCVISFPVYIDATAPITDSLGTYHDALGADSVTGVLAANNVGFSAGPSDGVTLVVNDGVTIRKSFYPTTVAPNGVADLKITLTNVNAMPLTGVSYQDPLPAGLVLAGNGSPAFSADCGAASLSSDVVNGQTVLTIANAGVPAATGSPVNPGTCVLDVYVQQAAGQPQSANYPNQIVAGSMSSDQGISNTQSSNTATLSVGDLSIAVSKSFAQATVTAGETTSMSIVVANPQTANGATLNNVSFQDAFPAGLIAAANPNVQVVCSAGSTGAPANASLSSATPPVLSVAGIVLAPSGSCTISVDVQLTTANAPVTNVIAGGTVTTSEGATNVGDASATIVGVPASAVVKSIAPATATIGQPVTATVRVLNTTAGAIGNIDVLD